MTNLTDLSRDQLLVGPLTPVTCPQCAHEFSLADGFARKSLEALEEASHGALARLRDQARALEERRAKERAAQDERLLQVERDAMVLRAKALAEKEAGLRQQIEIEAAARAEVIADQARMALEER